MSDRVYVVIRKLYKYPDIRVERVSGFFIDYERAQITADRMKYAFESVVKRDTYDAVYFYVDEIEQDTFDTIINWEDVRDEYC